MPVHLPSRNACCRACGRTREPGTLVSGGWQSSCWPMNARRSWRVRFPMAARIFSSCIHAKVFSFLAPSRSRACLCVRFLRLLRSLRGGTHMHLTAPFIADDAENMGAGDLEHVPATLLTFGAQLILVVYDADSRYRVARSAGNFDATDRCCAYGITCGLTDLYVHTRARARVHTHTYTHTHTRTIELRKRANKHTRNKS